ncbi:hypothetical protein OIE67_08720 [Nonomuraea fuscirosea]|uniref:hypothetical protein n=1 Tax=Nonomuraea fuscirosea TaxID=1291556 RepID=UPI002DDA3ED5|nr:hypothetical protein [Nonomuraea fuscirosea]WSA54692.1 hypothetical protein OIE67_08720 [Nonomuraea fuscirosea]
MVARVVDNTGDPLTRPLTVTADAPLTATPATSCLDVPAHQGVTAAVRIIAPRDTPPGEHRVTVTVGDEPIEVPVTVTETCTELDARLKTAGFAAVEARYVRLEETRESGGSYLSAADVSTG